MKQRLGRVVSVYLILLVTGIGYALLCRITGWGVPCLFNLVTGLKCPGCGVSRMFIALMRMDIENAFLANPAILCMLPAGVIVAGRMTFVYVKTGSLIPERFINAVIWAMIVLLLIFGVVRNII